VQAHTPLLLVLVVLLKLPTLLETTVLIHLLLESLLWVEVKAVVVVHHLWLLVVLVVEVGLVR
jgi:hypothetical protein